MKSLHRKSYPRVQQDIEKFIEIYFPCYVKKKFNYEKKKKKKKYPSPSLSFVYNLKK